MISNISYIINTLFDVWNKNNSYIINDIKGSDCARLSQIYLDLIKTGTDSKIFKNSNNLIVAYSLLKEPFVKIFTSPNLKNLNFDMKLEIDNFIENIIIPNIKHQTDFLVVKFNISLKQ
jgi:hypothetical protein